MFPTPVAARDVDAADDDDVDTADVDRLELAAGASPFSADGLRKLANG